VVSTQSTTRYVKAIFFFFFFFFARGHRQSGMGSPDRPGGSAVLGDSTDEETPPENGQP
jgi:hypothetical protein